MMAFVLGELGKALPGGVVVLVDDCASRSREICQLVGRSDDFELLANCVTMGL